MLPLTYNTLCPGALLKWRTHWSKLEVPLVVFGRGKNSPVLSWLCFPSCFCECLQQIGNGCYQRVSRIIHHPWTFLHIHLQGEPQDKEMFINLKHLTFLRLDMASCSGLPLLPLDSREHLFWSTTPTPLGRNPRWPPRSPSTRFKVSTFQKWRSALQRFDEMFLINNQHALQRTPTQRSTRISWGRITGLWLKTTERV